MATTDDWTRIIDGILGDATKKLDDRGLPAWGPWWGRMALTAVHAHLLTAADTLRSQSRLEITVTDQGDSLMVVGNGRFVLVKRSTTRDAIEVLANFQPGPSEAPPHDMERIEPWARAVAARVVQRLVGA
jgi:hypothetical protein